VLAVKLNVRPAHIGLAEDTLAVGAAVEFTTTVIVLVAEHAPEFVA
jgi:hypothetical protein